MADLIDRDAVIWITAETGALETQRRVKELPAVNRWIPVEDALPEIYEKVLTADIYGYVTENYRCNVRTGLEWAKGFRITHWMPKPEPPEKE